MSDIKVGDIININNGNYLVPDNVLRLRVEIHGGKGGDGGRAYPNGENGDRLSFIIDYNKSPSLGRDLKIIKGEKGENGTAGKDADGYGSYAYSGGGGGGGSTGVTSNDILLGEVKGGNGGNSAKGKGTWANDVGLGGNGGLGYHGGEKGCDGDRWDGKGGPGGGSTHINSEVTLANPTQTYSSGLIIIEILKINNLKYILKSNDHYYSVKPEHYSNNKYNLIPELEGKNLLTKSDYDIYGFNDLNILTQNTTINSQTFRPIDKLQKQFDSIEILQIKEK